MRQTKTLRESAATWHWGVHLLVCGVFLILGIASIVISRWVALILAVIGLFLFGQCAYFKWRKIPSRADDIDSSTLLTDLDRHQQQLVSLTPLKLLILSTSGLACPLYFSWTSQHFRPSEWGSMYWVMSGLLWLVGVLLAAVVYMWITHLAYRVSKSK